MAAAALMLSGCGEKGPTTVEDMTPEAKPIFGRLSNDSYRLNITARDTSQVNRCRSLKERLASAQVRFLTSEADSTYTLGSEGVHFQPDAYSDFCFIYIDRIEVNKNILFILEYSPATFSPADSARISISPVPWP